ncbi:MAG: N-acyl homoserine lactonase family protein [Deltaproteobacteria bacterium]|nr:N-acyl homoserine lactonase family protein [Deltaproteobacteria bacterium]
MLQIFSMPCGWLEFDSKIFFPERKRGEQMITIPVPSYLITHPQGNVVFDTGVHCSVMKDPVARLGVAGAKSFTSRSKPNEEIVAQLAQFKLTPNDIKYVINSHFHFDHCGGNEFFPQSTILVQKNELQTARDPELNKKTNFDPQDWNHTLNYQAVDGELDLFGDGALVLFPTHGHTPGHQSLRVQVTKSAAFVMTGDACYTKSNMDENRLPLIASDRDEMYRSLGKLRDLRDKAGATILYGHDPDQWREIPHAPNALA